jgi:hypothetical protein
LVLYLTLKRKMGCLMFTIVKQPEGEVVEFEWYATWWQELREKIFPVWYTTKYPSKTEIKKKVEVYTRLNNERK